MKGEKSPRGLLTGPDPKGTLQAATPIDTLVTAAIASICAILLGTLRLRMVNISLEVPQGSTGLELTWYPVWVQVGIPDAEGLLCSRQLQCARRCTELRATMAGISGGNTGDARGVTAWDSHIMKAWSRHLPRGWEAIPRGNLPRLSQCRLAGNKRAGLPGAGATPALSRPSLDPGSLGPAGGAPVAGGWPPCLKPIGLGVGIQTLGRPGGCPWEF